MYILTYTFIYIVTRKYDTLIYSPGCGEGSCDSLAISGQ